MNESKVVRYYIGIKGRLFAVGNTLAEVPDVHYVTHADYKALEEKYAALLKTEREGYTEYHRTLEELASLKARVRELVEASHPVALRRAPYGRRLD